MTKEQQVITDAKELINLEQYGVYTDFKDCADIIKKLLYIIEGKECVIETQTHNEEVLMEYFDRHTCLHCGKGKPGYCEDCYQDLIAENAKLQKEIDYLANMVSFMSIGLQPVIDQYEKEYCEYMTNNEPYCSKDLDCNECIKAYARKKVQDEVSEK